MIGTTHHSRAGAGAASDDDVRPRGGRVRARRTSPHDSDDEPRPRSRTGGAVAMARLDWWTVRSYGRAFALFVVVVLGCAIALSDATFLVTMGAVYVALMASYPFAVAEKNDLDTLYATLPLSRRGFVAGRYLFAGLLFVVTELVMTALAVALGAATGRPVAGDAVTTMLAVCAAAYATVVAIQFPVFCRTGYTRARLVALLPFLALVPVGMLLDRLDLHWTLPAPPVTLLLAVGYGVLVLAASAAVSERLVARRLP